MFPVAPQDTKHATYIVGSDYNAQVDASSREATIEQGKFRRFQSTLVFRISDHSDARRQSVAPDTLVSILEAAMI